MRNAGSKPERVLQTPGDHVFLTKQPKERMIQKLGQQIRINRSKIKDTSDTNTDWDDLDGAISGGYFLKEGIGNRQK